MIVHGTVSSTSISGPALHNNEETKMTTIAKAQCFGSSTSFPIKLHALLEDAGRLGFDDVVCWQAGGTSFKVLQPKRFDDEIMKIYFHQTKYKSFQRQLNIYGFRRFHHGPLKGGYAHPRFTREKPDLQMTRKQKHGVARSKMSALTMPTPDAVVSANPVAEGVLALIDSNTFGDDFDDMSAVEMNDLLSDFLISYDTIADSKPQEDANTNPSFNFDEPTEDSPVEPEQVMSNSVDENASSSTDRYFPCKLYVMLEDAEKDNFADIVSWVENGTAFKVHKRKEFVEQVMPNYFDQTQFESFRRQLNMYGFTRINKGKDRGVAAHPKFLRGHRMLCNSVTRVSKAAR